MGNNQHKNLSPKHLHKYLKIYYNTLDEYEKKQIIKALKSLRTPRDEMYKTEIRKLEDNYALLAMEHQSALKTIESFDNVRVAINKYDEIDLKQLVTNELANIRALRDTYESHSVARYSTSISELKKLAIEYKEMTLYFRKLDTLLALTFDVSEAHTEVIKVVDDTMKEFRNGIQNIMASGTKAQTKIMEKIVRNFFSNCNRILNMSKEN